MVATKRSRAGKTIILAVMVGLVAGMLFGPAEAKKKKRTRDWLATDWRRVGTIRRAD